MSVVTILSHYCQGTFLLSSTIFLNFYRSKRNDNNLKNRKYPPISRGAFSIIGDYDYLLVPRIAKEAIRIFYLEPGTTAAPVGFGELPAAGISRGIVRAVALP